MDYAPETARHNEFGLSAAEPTVVPMPHNQGLQATAGHARDLSSQSSAAAPEPSRWPRTEEMFMGLLKKLFGGRANPASDPGEDTLRLITHINQRSLNALAKTQGERWKGLDENATIAVQLLREYGYGANTLVWNGDGELLFKGFRFTQECVHRDMIKSKGAGIDLSAELADPVGATSLFLEMFTPSQRAAIQYEIMQAKPPNGDDRRKELLQKAGYDASGGLRLTSARERGE
jgi:hypothetical protein